MKRKRGKAPPAPRPPKLLTAGLWLAAAGTPLAWTTFLTAEYVLPKLLVLTIGVLIAAAGLALSSDAATRIIRRTPLDKALLAAFTALALATLFSLDPLRSILGTYNSMTYGVWPMSLYAALYFLSAWALDAYGRRRLVNVCLGAGTIVACYAVLQALNLEPFTLSGALPEGRAVSTIGSPVHLGAYLAVVFPLALQRVFDGGKNRVPAAIALALVAGGLWAAVSRGGWVAAALGGAVYLALAGKLRLPPSAGKGNNRPARTAAPCPPRLKPAGRAAAAAAALLIVGVLGYRASVRQISMGDRARIAAWRTALEIFADHPLLGVGPDAFGLEFRRRKDEDFLRSRGTFHHHNHAHNDFMQALATTGLAGTLAYLWLLIALCLAARTALRDPARGGEAAAAAGGLLALFIAMKFNPMSLEVMVLAALLAGVLGAPDKDSPGFGRVPLRALALALFAAALGSVLAAGRISAADRHMQAARILLGAGRSEAGLARLRRASTLNECELKYRILRINHLVEKVRAEKEPAVRIALAAEAARSGLTAVRCHPKDFNSHYMYGYASLVQAQLGLKDRLPVAEHELDAALKLDPTFGPILGLRLTAARLGGDHAKQAEILRRQVRIRALTAS